MGLMCTGCYEKKAFYEIELCEEYHPYHVGICKCGSDVCEVDDLIIDAVMVLNKKGWTTEYSCSGHNDESRINTYIKFEKMPPTSPVGFFQDNMKCIRFKNRDKNLGGLRGFDLLLVANRNLYKWALELPSAEG